MHTGRAYENLLSPRDQLSGCRLRILKRIERHEVHSDGVESFIGISETHMFLLLGQNLEGAKLHWVCAGNERCITRDILRAPQPVRARRIKIAAITDIVQVRGLRCVERAPMCARKGVLAVVAKHVPG